MEKKDTVEQLEALVDKHGLLYIVQALELMCYEKAEHLRVNWQDGKTARAWDAAGKACYRATQIAAIVS